MIPASLQNELAERHAMRLVLLAGAPVVEVRAKREREKELIRAHASSLKRHVVGWYRWTSRLWHARTVLVAFLVSMVIGWALAQIGLGNVVGRFARRGLRRFGADETFIP